MDDLTPYMKRVLDDAPVDWEWRPIGWRAPTMEALERRGLIAMRVIRRHMSDGDHFLDWQWKRTQP